MRKILFPAALVAVQAWCSVLDSAAAALQPGQWADITAATGVPSTFFDGIGGSSGYPDAILNYAYKGCWFPDSQWILFSGCGHNNTGGGKFIVYRARENTWETRPGRNNTRFWHSYGFNAIDVTRGYYYFYNPREGNSPCGWRPVERYNLRTGVWDSAGIFGGACTQTGMLEYFPERDTLVFFGNSLSAFRVMGADQYGTVVGAAPGHRGYENLGVYSPVHRMIMAGFGYDGDANGDIPCYASFLLDSAYRVTEAAPCSIEAASVNGVLTADPVSGDFLLMGGTGRFASYDPAEGFWRSLPTPTVPVYGNFKVAIPVPELGVIVCLKRLNYVSRVYLYRHDSTAGEPMGVDAGHNNVKAAGDRLFSITPNPLQGTCRLIPDRPATAEATLRVYDSRGRLVADLTAGLRTGPVITWTPSGLPSGLYWVRYTGKGFNVIRQVVSMR